MRPIKGRCNCGRCNFSYLVEKGPITAAFRKHVWTVGDDRRVYVACVVNSCRTIIKIDDYIQEDGHVTNCAVCRGCGGHQFLRFVDWDPRKLKSRPSDPWENRCPFCHYPGALCVTSISGFRYTRDLDDGKFIYPNGPDLRLSDSSDGRVVCAHCGERYSLSVFRRKKGDPCAAR